MIKRILIIVMPVVLLLIFSIVYAQESLKSNFFKNDPIAQKIADGEMKYDMNDFELVCGSFTRPNPDKYGFKILNGIKQLGYLHHKGCHVPGDKTAIIILNNYQRKNGLQESNYVDRDVLLKIDSQLAESEKRDTAIGPTFTCYEHLTEAPLNDASKNHLAFLYNLALNAYPANLRVKKDKGFNECFNDQTFDYRQIIEQGNIKHLICDTGYWPGYYDNCSLRNVPYEIYGLSRDDYTTVQTIVHEHAHFMDKNIYNGDNKIDTTAFYDISYDTLDKVQSGWAFYKLRINMDDKNQLKQHFFSYAPGWSDLNNKNYFTAYEDFAVSMEMYVLHGIEFRNYMKDKPILAKKYNWIKENVFKGVEFDTGDQNYKNYAPDLYNIGQGIIAAGGITQLRPNYVWDYEIKKLNPPTQQLLCGNKRLDTGEHCDGSIFGAIKKCTDFTLFRRGNLKCTLTCQLDTSDCSQTPLISTPPIPPFCSRFFGDAICDDSREFCGEEYTEGYSNDVCMECQRLDESGNIGFGSCAKTTVTPLEPLAPYEYTVQLKRGWNLFSAPALAHLRISPSGLGGFESGCSYKSKLWSHSQKSKKYEKSSYEEGSLRGYWVKVDSDCGAVVRGLGVFTAAQFISNLNLEKGWNVIGGVPERMEFEEIKGDCVFEKVKDGKPRIYSFNPVLNKYEKTNAMEPGKGYIVKVNDKCRFGQQ